MFCTRCGKGSPDSARFCYNCGNALQSVAPTPPAPKDQPAEPILVQRTILKEIGPANGACFAFEKKVVIIELVQAEDTEFVRITDYENAAGANGRPQYSLLVDYYAPKDVDLTHITAQNYMEKVNGAPIYHRARYECGVLY